MSAFCLCVFPLWSENRNLSQPGERVIAVVPMIGSGTPDDPRRPMFVPTPKEISAAMEDGQAPQWIGCHYVMSDDGQSAVVEFVGTNRQALKPVLEAARAGSIQAFEPNKISAANLHNTLKRLKANFDWSAFRGVPATSTSPATSLPVGGAN